MRKRQENYKEADPEPWLLGACSVPGAMLAWEGRIIKGGKEGSMNKSVGKIASYCFNSFITSKRKFQMDAMVSLPSPSACYKRGKKGKWEGEKETSVCRCFSHVLYWRPGPQTRHVPSLGIELVALWFAGQHSNHWATPARAYYFSLSERGLRPGIFRRQQYLARIRCQCFIFHDIFSTYLFWFNSKSRV